MAAVLEGRLEGDEVAAAPAVVVVAAAAPAVAAVAGQLFFLLVHSYAAEELQCHQIDEVCGAAEAL